MSLSQADVFRIPLAAGSVHCCVTSPPYWGLRKYAGEQGTEPLGLEATPERHIERTVAWAREVWRVLRDDGVLWLNLGDLFWAGAPSGGTSRKAVQDCQDCDCSLSGRGDERAGDQSHHTGGTSRRPWSLPAPESSFPNRENTPAVSVPLASSDSVRPEAHSAVSILDLQ